MLPNYFCKKKKTSTYRYFWRKLAHTTANVKHQTSFEPKYGGFNLKHKVSAHGLGLVVQLSQRGSFPFEFLLFFSTFLLLNFATFILFYFCFFYFSTFLLQIIPRDIKGLKKIQPIDSESPQLSMNPGPNITSYHVCMEDGGGNGGKSGFG